MAYTIISQNNSTTTLSDGVNTITVPSRVNLTSGNFTIVEVNNNMATLEDGDGNVYRDIPCVATLVDAGGGGSSYTAGTGIDITGGVISVTSPTVVNTGTGQHTFNLGRSEGNPANNGTAVGINSYLRGYASVAIGMNSVANNNSVAVGSAAGGQLSEGAVSVGANATADSQGAISIGTQTKATANYAIQLGCGNIYTGATNNVANTFKVANANGNYEIMSANGTIPTARLTKVNTTVTLTSADWSGGSQTVTVTGMTATGVVFPSPVPADQSAYTSAGILCTAQAANSLTFTCSTTPSADIDVNVVML